MRTVKIFAIFVVLMLGMCMIASASGTGHATIIHKSQPVAPHRSYAYTSEEHEENHETTVAVPYFCRYSKLVKK